MPRNRNTNRSGGAWTKAEIDAVWAKATPIPGQDKNVRRRDVCGHEIEYGAHGNTSSRYGWEIDHIKPVSKGGGDDLDNLQPLYWETNRDKADLEPWRCP